MIFERTSFVEQAPSLDPAEEYPQVGMHGSCVYEVHKARKLYQFLAILYLVLQNFDCMLLNFIFQIESGHISVHSKNFHSSASSPSSTACSGVNVRSPTPPNSRGTRSQSNCCFVRGTETEGIGVING